MGARHMWAVSKRGCLVLNGEDAGIAAGWVAAVHVDGEVWVQLPSVVLLLEDTAVAGEC